MDRKLGFGGCTSEQCRIWTSQAPSIDARGALLYIIIPARYLSLSLSPTWLSSSVSLLHPRFQPMPPFDVGPVSLCYLASLQALSASSPFEIYPFDYPFSFLSSPSKHTLSLKTSNILSTGKNIGFTWLSSAYDIDLRDSMANKFKWTVPAPLATVQTQD